MRRALAITRATCSASCAGSAPAIRDSASARSRSKRSLSMVMERQRGRSDGERQAFARGHELDLAAAELVEEAARALAERIDDVVRVVLVVVEHDQLLHLAFDRGLRGVGDRREAARHSLRAIFG